MFLSNLSIRRPVFAAVVMLALVTLGIFSYRHLNIDLYPDVEIPVLIITTAYKGAPPESVEREITRRIEEAVNTVQGIKHISSTSQEGLSSIAVEFTLETRINDAAQETRAKVSAIRGDLPKESEESVIQKLDFSAAPVISLAVRSDVLDARDLTTLVDKRIKRRIENISGVGRVDLVGNAKREVNVWLDPVHLDALGLGLNEIISGLHEENVDTPLGRLNDQGYEMPVRISGKPKEVWEYPEMVVAWREGRPIRLKDFARIQDGVEEQRTLALVDGEPAVALNVLKQSGANTVAVADRVKRVAADLTAELPAGVRIQVVRDESNFIRESVEDVQMTLILGGLLTIFIVFCFLNSWRSTVITGLTLPISVISSFIIIMALGFTLNVMTLMGLSLAIGLLIDDAIVVRENIVRHLQQGKDHRRASLEGTAEIGLAVMATTFTIVAVFVPVAFMKGIVGRFFYQFGITVAFAVLVSLLVSFTLDPMLSSRWVDPDVEGEHGGARKGRGLIFRLLVRFNRLFERLAERYQHLIGWALEHRKTVLAAGLASFVGALYLAPYLGSSFFPTYDRAEFQVNFTASPDAGLEESRGRLQAILKVLHSLPGLHLTYATVGAGTTGTVREGGVYVKLKEKHERRHTQEELEAMAREGIARIPGIVPSILVADSLQSAAPINMNLKGDDLELLNAISQELKKLMTETPGVVDVSSSLDQEKTEVRLLVDRARAVNVGMSTAQVVDTLSPLVGGLDASTYEDLDGDAYDVRVRLPEAYRRDPAQLGRLNLLAVQPDGRRLLVPVGDIAKFRLDVSPARIQRLDLRRQVTLSANNVGVALGDAIEAIVERVKTVMLPPGFTISWSGEAEDMAETFRYIFEALALAVILIYLILAAQFESFIAPLAIMISLPLSLVGVIGVLFFTGDTLNIMSLIGLIMLMGLVTKNAILLVDYAKVLGKSGLDRRSALIQAGRTRLRPIIMTTLAMVFGMLPLALALGPGAEMRAPMARAVIGGLVTSTLLTLIVVPVVFTVLDDLEEWFRRRLKVMIVLAALILATAVPAAAEDVITLNDCLEKTLAYSREVLIAGEGKNMSEGRYLEERAAALPQLKAEARAARVRDEAMEIFGVPPDYNSYGGNLGLTQALFTWGQISAAIKAATYDKVSAEEQYREAKQLALREASTSFYTLLLALELEKAARDNVAQKRRHLDESERRYQLEVATDYDVLAGRVALTNAEPALIQAVNDIRLAKDRLRYYMGIEGDFDASGSLNCQPTPPEPLDHILERAKANRPEVAYYESRVGVFKELVTVAQAGNKPRLDFKGNAGWSRDDSFNQDYPGYRFDAGIYLSFPIFDGFLTKGKVMQAKSRLATTELEMKQLLDRIALDARNALNRVDEAVHIVKGLEAVTTQAERLLEMAETGYRHGVKTRLEVDDAESNLLTARTNLARARTEYLIARTRLLWIMGEDILLALTNPTFGSPCQADPSAVSGHAKGGSSAPKNTKELK